jgi:hypothetical protein
MTKTHATLLGLAIAALMLSTGCATKPTPSITPEGSIGSGIGDDVRGELYGVQIPPTPTSSTPAQPVAVSSVYSNGQISISWHVVSNGNWRLEESNDLVGDSWTYADGALYISSGLVESVTSPTNMPSYYRLIHRNP